MHKTHIFDQKNNAKIFFLPPTYLPYFFSDRYRKQTVYFFRPNENNYNIIIENNKNDNNNNNYNDNDKTNNLIY